MPKDWPVRKDVRCEPPAETCFTSLVKASKAAWTFTVAGLLFGAVLTRIFEYANIGNDTIRLIFFFSVAGLTLIMGVAITWLNWLHYETRRKRKQDEAALKALSGIGKDDNDGRRFLYDYWRPKP